ncbi:MAG: cation-translocating P-type ATPase [Deltaproteobacteria bacterium]|jgi:Cu+-exporting ATPase|nr:cation-translocating P-type ATPase [Deltaproteobacteria bacterium]MCL5879968.1 cation-translocating P-type ATPase [Deltaproteobacteria bacterium]MDA8304370.1 cation-translocating P-type ATPase [Deltaproteobacteria bacterium]
MFDFIKKIKEKQKPLNCDFCGAKVVKQSVTAEVKTPPYMLNFCCYGCKIGYLALGKSESSISNLIINDLELSGRIPIFKKAKGSLSFASDGEGGNRISFGIKGVTCTSCIPVIEKALELQENVVSAKVNPVSHIVTLDLEKNESSIKAIKNVLKKLGYSISEYDDSYDNLKEESYSLLARFGFGIFMSMNIMVFSLLLYSKYFLKLRNEIVNYSHFILWAFTTAIVIVVGYPIFKSAFKKFAALTYNSDTLISIGVLSAYIYSSFITFGLYKKSSGVFFDTAAMILILITFGKFLDASAKRASLSGLHNLTLLRPDSAALVSNGEEKKIDVKDIEAGDTLAIKAGELIPTDGELLSEYAIVDESMYNGEPLPANKKSGDSLIGGSINRGEDITMRASTRAYSSYLFKMIRFAERAYNMKIEPLRYIDEISKIFIPLIISVAFLTFVFYYFFTNNLDLSLVRFISVLVVACPCAFGLAAPLVITNGISKAQKDKILINGSETLEMLNNVGTVIFDKTGTLTEGLPEIKEVVLFNAVKNGIAYSKDELIQIAGLIEKNISDRIAEAFKRKKDTDFKISNSKTIKEDEVTDIIFKIGYGVSAKYLDKKVLIGNNELLKMHNIILNEDAEKKALEYEKDGATAVYLSIEDKPVCLFVIMDKIKDGAKEAVKSISGLGKKVVMLSGDNEEAVNYTASKAGIPVENAYFRMKPDDKLEFVENLKKDKNNGLTAFVGDGLNDIPAMEEADISILSLSRYEIPSNHANIVLLDGNLKNIIKLFDISINVKKIIKENLLFSFIYNFIAIPLAVIGILNPLSAAVSMMVSSIFITLNSLKIHMHKNERIIKSANKKFLQKKILNTLRG